MGGGSQTSTSYVKNDTSNIPEYAAPYFTGLLASTQAATDVTKNPYTPYGADRIAEFNPAQTQVQNEVMSRTTPQQFGAASTLAGTAGLGALQTSQYNPTAFKSQAASAGSAGVTDATQLGGINPQIVQQYMSPYTQNVLDIEKREALANAQKTQLLANLGAARQGTYGGSRQLLAATERERALGQLFGDIQSKGLQAAYDKALGQFNTEQGLRQQVNLANLDARTRAQIANADYATRIAMANQQADLEAQKLAEQSKQFGATQGLAGLAQANQSAQTLVNAGTAEQQAEAARLAQQAAAGKEMQTLEQQKLDLAYQDFLKQQNYEKDQLSFMSQILRGLPVQPNTSSTTTATTPNPSLISQVANAGLGVAGLSKIV